MPPTSDGRDGRAATGPSMLDLIGLSPRLLFPPGGEELYRQIALLTGMGEQDEVLDVSCRKAVSLEYFVRELRVQGSGVDVDPAMIRRAEERARLSDLGGRIQFQSAPSDALPFRDDVFDVSVGELALAAECDPGDAVAELVRVTKPGGHVVLIQLVWKAPVDTDRRRLLASHLGTRPRMLVEWKRSLKERGVRDLHSEDWSDEQTSFRATVVKPFPDFAEIFTLWEKIGILRRAWEAWGWSGVRTALQREYEVHRLLTRERILGLNLLKGRVAAAPTGTSRIEDQATEPGETAGLPLFDREDEPIGPA